MEATLWELIKRLAPLGPSFVSVTYGAGGSTRERTHATVARIVKETASQARRASDLRRGGAGRDRRRRPRLLGHRRPPHRRAARRSARWTGDEIPPASGGLCEFGRAGCRNQDGSPISKSRSRPIRKATRKRLGRCRHRCLESQGRCRREPGDHPVLFRKRNLFAVSRQGAGAGT